MTAAELNFYDNDIDGPTRAALSRAVTSGLGARFKTLPAWIFYDAHGSELFEQITELPEYYLTRAEREILHLRSDEIVKEACGDGDTEMPLKIIELGAGSATKTQLLLDAVVRRQGRCLYMPIDVSATALEGAVSRLNRESPQVNVRPFAGTHLAALPTIRDMGSRRLIVFLGSSVGNYSDEEAVDLLSAVAAQLQPGGALLLGTDRRKDVPTMLQAYDDGAGVTAAFNLNMLTRLNRELDANFDIACFRHEARWNESSSCVEMHLVSIKAQRVTIPHVGEFLFEAGESIHTERSTKYSQAHVERLVEDAGFEHTFTFSDSGERFDLHLARLAA